MKEIALTKGKSASVSNEDFERISQYKWQATNNARHQGCEKWYAVTKISLGRQKYRRVYMHRFVMEPIPAGMVIDHIDGNSLNNTRSNLRIVTPSQNAKHQYHKPKRSDPFL